MKKIAIFILIFIVSVFSIQKSFADEGLSEKMDFFAAVNYSLENNDNIRAMRKGLSASERNIGIARSEMMPKLRFNEIFVSTNNPTDTLSYRLNQAVANSYDLEVNTLNHPPAVANFLTAGVLEQQILNKKAMVQIKMAKKEYSANGYVFLRKQEELVNQVALAYLRVKTNMEFIKITDDSIKEAKDHLKKAESEYKNSKGTYSDVLRARTETKEREEKLISYKKEYEVSKRALGLLLGLEQSIDISQDIPEIKLQTIDYYKTFCVYRNDIKATEIRVQNAKNNIKSAQAEWYPTLNAIASYNFNSGNYPFGGSGSNYIAGVYFRWDVFDGNKRKYEILQAKDKEAEAKEYLKGLKKAVSFKVFESYQNVVALQRNLELAVLTQKEAEEDMKLVSQRWQKSLTPFVSLIDAQTDLDGARANVIKCRNDLKAALINLAYESGIIYQELSLK